MNKSTKYVMLQQKEVFSTLTEEDLCRLAEQGTYQEVKKGQRIFDQGQTIRYVYLVEKGGIKLATTAESGKTLIKNLIYEDEIFGENIFSNQRTRLNYAEAASTTGYFALPVDLFKDIVSHNPLFAQVVMDIVIHRLQILEQRMQSFVFKNAKVRIFDFIKSAAKRRGIRIGVSECLIDHGMSHKDIAHLTDTSRQTVARVMSELKKANLIHFSARKPGKVLIRNFAV